MVNGLCLLVNLQTFEKPKKKKALEFPRLFSGSRGSRTPDPLLVRQML